MSQFLSENTWQEMAVYQHYIGVFGTWLMVGLFLVFVGQVALVVAHGRVLARGRDADGVDAVAVEEIRFAPRRGVAVDPSTVSGQAVRRLI